MRITIYSTTVFAFSVSFGMFLAILIVQYGTVSYQFARWRKLLETPHEQLYKYWLTQRHVQQSGPDVKVTGKVIGEADYLYSSIQLLCWVMLNGDGEHINVWPFSPSADSARKTIGQTWGKRCAKTIFYTNSQDGDSEAIHLNTHNLNSWEALHEVVSHTAKDGDIERYDWFLKVEEDTFLIVENLLYYLSVYNSSLPHYFGNPYQKWGSTYNAGGPGYVLSRTALRKLHNQLVKGHCPKSGSTEDLTLGSCLEEIGVAPQDTRDALGRARFLMYQPESLLVPGNLPWSEKIWAQAKFPSGEDFHHDQ